MSYPENYRYSKSHEWMLLEGDSATVGITDYAQESLGDIVFVELPKVGAEFEVGATFGSVESVKAVSDLYTPVGGTVTAVNSALNDAPEMLNKAANETWVIRFAVKGAPVEGLLSADEYQKFVAEESGH
ncbi:MAG: glycine cleavage system protein GcvH [Acidobacteriaceae bacterium]